MQIYECFEGLRQNLFISNPAVVLDGLGGQTLQIRVVQRIDYFVDLSASQRLSEGLVIPVDGVQMSAVLQQLFDHRRFRRFIERRHVQGPVLLGVPGLGIRPALQQHPHGVDGRELADRVAAHAGALFGAGQMQRGAGVPAPRVQLEKVVDGGFDAVDLLLPQVGHESGEQADQVQNDD